MQHKYLCFFVFGFLLSLFLIGCKSKYPVVSIMPCESETIDDSAYIRELGHGTSASLQHARNIAIQDARFKIYNRFCDSVRTYMPQVNYNANNDSLFVGFQDTILFRYPLSYFGELSYTRKECEKITFDANHQYHCFMTLALPKEDIEHASNKVFFDFLSFMSEGVSSANK